MRISEFNLGGKRCQEPFRGRKNVPGTSSCFSIEPGPNDRGGRRNRWFQFTLRSLFFILIAASVVLGVYRWWQSNQVARQRELLAAQRARFAAQRARLVAGATPLEWAPFTQAKLDDSLRSGRPVLVVYFAHWKSRPLWRIETEEFRLAIHDHNKWEKVPGTFSCFER